MNKISSKNLRMLPASLEAFERVTWLKARQQQQQIKALEARAYASRA